MSEQPVTPDPRIEAALEADKQYNTNGLCHFGVQCDDCDCFYQPERDDPRYRARMTFVLAAADAVDPRRAKTHWGVSPMHGGLTQHVGPFEECSAPDCADEPERVLERMSAELARYQAAVQAVRGLLPIWADEITNGHGSRRDGLRKVTNGHGSRRDGLRKASEDLAEHLGDER